MSGNSDYIIRSNQHASRSRQAEIPLSGLSSLIQKIRCEVPAFSGAGLKAIRLRCTTPRQEVSGCHFKTAFAVLQRKRVANPVLRGSAQGTRMHTVNFISYNKKRLSRFFPQGSNVHNPVLKEWSYFLVNHNYGK